MTENLILKSASSAVRQACKNVEAGKYCDSTRIRYPYTIIVAKKLFAP